MFSVLIWKNNRVVEVIKPFDSKFDAQKYIEREKLSQLTNLTTSVGATVSRRKFAGIVPAMHKKLG
jgi:hypothetical protein